MISRPDTEYGLEVIPDEPEWRPGPTVAPGPTRSMEELVDEMFAEDPEAIAWRDAERLSDVFGRGPR